MASFPELAGWYAALEARHLERLSFQEVRRSLQALSSLYVERRERIAGGAALDGAGKRAAFALFYAPLHALLVREAARALGAGTPPPRRIVDLGCGTGAAGCALALEAGTRTAVAGIDLSGWALDEAAWNARTLGVAASFRRGDAVPAARGGDGDLLVAAFLANEMEAGARDALVAKLLAARKAGARVLVVEPIARRALAWWPAWEAAFAAAGGRADVWRFPAELPERMRLLDEAAGLDHREITGRTLWLG